MRERKDLNEWEKPVSCSQSLPCNELMCLPTVLLGVRKRKKETQLELLGHARAVLPGPATGNILPLTPC